MISESALHLRFAIGVVGHSKHFRFWCRDAQMHLQLTNFPIVFSWELNDSQRRREQRIPISTPRPCRPCRWRLYVCDFASPVQGQASADWEFDVGRAPASDAFRVAQHGIWSSSTVDVLPLDWCKQAHVYCPTRIERHEASDPNRHQLQRAAGTVEWMSQWCLQHWRVSGECSRIFAIQHAHPHGWW